MRQVKDLKPLLMLSIVALALTVACGGQPQPAQEEPAEPTAAEPAQPETLAAVAELHGREGSGITGTVTFCQMGDGGPVTIQADVQGVEGAGLHGFHIHETGDCSAPDFTSAGGHFNPDGVEHACPPDTPRHAGDLGNIEIGEDGSGNLDQSSDLISLHPDDANSVIGKAVILHEGEDDCQTQPTGDAGGRLACGVIKSGMNGGDMDHEDHDNGDMEDNGDEGEM
jgi:Cu-Zn family superoxide dismutase